MRSAPGPLYSNGAEIDPIEIAAFIDRVEKRLGSLPDGGVVVLPKAPIPNILARVASWRRGVGIAVEERALRIAGISRAAYISPHGEVHKQENDGVDLIPGVARLLITSGSGGEPRAVAHDRTSIEDQSRVLRSRLQLDGSDRMLLPLSVNHAYGASVVELWSRYGVGLDVVTESPLARLSSLIERTKPTSIDTVPSMLSALLKSAERNVSLAKALRGTRLINVGGDVLPRSVAEFASGQLGIAPLDGYGLTECGPNVAISSQLDRRRASVGRPLDGVQVEVSSSGEILVKSEGVMQGYVRNGEIDSSSIEHGWFHTGDNGRIDGDGYLYVHGRRKDTIIIHGETIAPRWLEDLLIEKLGHDKLAVVGIRPSGSGKDEVHIFIEDGDKTVDRGILIERCRQILPPECRPIRAHFVHAIPKLDSGKTDFVTLKKDAMTRC